MTNHLHIAAVALSLLAMGAELHAQDPTAVGKRFDVASVRPNRSDTVQNNVEATDAGLRLTNWALRPVIQLAYGVDQPSKLANVPGWTNTERFDIVARGAIASRDDLRDMLRSLLAERFKLATHTEQRSVDVYKLLRLQPERPLPPALRVSSAECLGPGGTNQAPSSTGTPRVRCGPQPGGRGKLILVGSPIGMLGGILSLMVGRPVLDDTGLDGRYDLELASASEADRAAGVDGPSVFTALQEQLGLKLEPGTQEQEVLVIDHVERPDPD